MIQELQDRIAALPGFDEARASKAIFVLFRIILEYFPGHVSQTVFDTVPGSYALASERRLPPVGPLGGFETMIGGALANHLGSGEDVLMMMLAEMKSAGFSHEESRAAGVRFVHFLVEKGGSSLALSLTEAVPGLSRLR